MKKATDTHKPNARDRAELQAATQLDSIEEMVQALNAAGDDDEAREQAEQTIREDALSVEVRCGWHVPGANDGEQAAEYQILLCTGGPAARIIGALTDHGEPDTARIEYQDWGTPWTEYRMSSADEEIVKRYAGQFFFAE
jgi:hypothetical protein